MLTVDSLLRNNTTCAVAQKRKSGSSSKTCFYGTFTILNWPGRIKMLLTQLLNRER